MSAASPWPGRTAVPCRRSTSTTSSLHWWIIRIRTRVRRDLRVRRVERRQLAPAAAAAYAEVFRAPVRFGAAADRISFSREEWDAPTDAGDAALARLLEEHARIMAERIPRVG